MFKHTYSIVYRLQPNKKVPGRILALNLTFNGRLTGNKQNQAKMLRTLCGVHRVNPNAVEVRQITLIKTELALREKIAAFFDKLLRRVPA